MTVKSLLIAMDGCEPAFLNNMIDSGELPNFTRLRERSSIMPVENDPAMGAAQFWECVAIGGGPDNHGHYFYMQFKPDTYDVIVNHESSLPEITTFWDTLDADGYKIGVIDWHRMRMSELNHGMLLSDWFAHDPLTNTQAWPPEILDTISAYNPERSNEGSFARIERKTAEELKSYLDILLETVEAKTKYCIDQIKQGDWDLLIPTFAEIHDVGHHYYHLEDTNHENFDPAIAEKIPNPIGQVYRKIDWAIGELLKVVDDNTMVSVVAGPGMETLISANNSLDDIVRSIDLGHFTQKTNVESTRAVYKNLFSERIRSILAPLARPIRRNFFDSAYRNRRFFSVPHNDNAGAIRINLKGRERYGTVSPGDEYDAVVKEITDAFSTFTNPDTGRPLVKRVVCIPHEYSGPHVDVLPDVFVEWDRTDTAHNFQQVTSDRYGSFPIPPTLRTGDHSPHGVYWTTDQLATDPSHKAPQRPGDLTDIILASVRQNPPIQPTT